MNDIRNRPAGFTLIELLAVLGIIALIAAISVPVITGFLGTSREAATATTLLKIDGWLTERREALDKALNQQDRTQTGRRDPDAQAKAYLERLANQNIYGIRLRAAQILMKKDAYRRYFPQSLAEAGLHAASMPSYNGNTTNDSAEALYWMLTEMDVFGVGSVSAGDFRASEVSDTDNDGFLEVIDAWGNPIRFYRWPTNLIRPASAVPPNTVDETIDRVVADVLIKGLPAPPESGKRDPLEVDPDDSIRLLPREAIRNPALDPLVNAAVYPDEAYHWRDTYHTPLLVSAGDDGEFGLMAQDDVAAFGHLAEPDGDVDAMLDNITNRNQRAGGG